MMSLRKLVCKPKIDDWAPLSKFFYADETLNAIASELDCFDGRKDPERCQQLVNQLRQCQDRVIQIIDEILNDVFPNESDRAPRDYRVKFPDDILHDSLPGQLWFGAECLSAGSNIIDRECESDAIRPLAKKLTCHLDSLREILKEQSLKNPTFYSEKVKKALRTYDSLFAEFELSYVSAMVPVKTAREYDMQQDVAVLFCQTLERAINKGYISQDLIDICDPSIMITLPRLAIISGLFIFLDGPLNVDRPIEQIADMFQPFKTLLQKIRDLLHTLTDDELQTLERALSSQEQLQLEQGKVTLIADYRSRTSSSRKAHKQKDKSVKNSNEMNDCSVDADGNENVDASSPLLTPESVDGVIERDDSSCSLNSNVSPTNELEIDVKIDDSSNDTDRSPSPIDVVVASSPIIAECQSASNDIEEEKTDPMADMMTKVWKNTRSKVLRSRFRSPEDLIHRLFVCIAGVADQWQSNYPSDLRAVLKMVFHPQDSVEVFEVHGRSAHLLGREEETGVDVGEQMATDNPSVVVPWVPDHECNSCVGCQRNFTFVLRRHHCRNCGKIFCARCSANTLILPKLGYSKPVRVCNQCFFYKLPTFTEAESG